MILLKNYRQATILLGCFALLLTAAAWGAVGGSISGTVKDATGSVVPNAGVTLKEVSTGLVYRTKTDSRGFYTLPVLPVGRYDLDLEARFSRLLPHGHRARHECIADSGCVTRSGQGERDSKRDRQCTACGDNRDAIGPGNHRPAR